ncbi:MAG: helix-turn-helix transcriptional regulator [Burkholderiaceae bacterium]|nr:helix-turn-helix transcriptional regulator [Burkholderiaceae bacterium]
MPASVVQGPGRAAGVGSMLREWRTRRRRSQMDLALDAGVSPRHLSFIETGRSRPSPSVLDAIAERLEVPLRERNRMLLAAGYAPRWRERALAEDAAMAPVRAALQRLLGAHDPYPGLVLDRHWNVVLANRAADALIERLPASLRNPCVNVFRASLHPQGMAAYTENFDAWAGYLLWSLRRALATSADPALEALQREVLAYPNVRAIRAAETRDTASADGLLLPCVLRLGGTRLSMFTTLTTFGTPRDVIIDELCIELFYPADAETEAALRQPS